MPTTAKLFPLAAAARLAGLTLEVTNEAARVLRLKVLDDVVLGSRLTFAGVRLLRALAPALARGVDPLTAEREARERAAADTVVGAGGRVLHLRPAIPRAAARRS